MSAQFNDMTDFLDPFPPFGPPRLREESHEERLVSRAAGSGYAVDLMYQRGRAPQILSGYLAWSGTGG